MGRGGVGGGGVCVCGEGGGNREGEGEEGANSGGHVGPAPVCKAPKTTRQLSRRHHPWQLTTAQLHCACLSLLPNRDDST